MVDHERASLLAAGRNDLSHKVRWVSDEDGDGLGYDIASFAPDGVERLIDVKTTNCWERTPFHISRNEVAVANERQYDWRLIRMWDFARTPKAFVIRPPLNRHVNLTPTSFLHHSDDGNWPRADGPLMGALDPKRTRFEPCNRSPKPCPFRRQMS